MTVKIRLLGDMNFSGETDASDLFTGIRDALAGADFTFANLECCFYDQPEDALETRGFYVAPASGAAAAMRDLGLDMVGNANNVTIGAEAIAASLSELETVGIAHVGAGSDAASACAPQVVDVSGVRIGVLQRTAVFWPDGEAMADRPGVAVIRGHTSYRPRLEEQSAQTRPGVPPEVMTWADPTTLERFREDVAALKASCDIALISVHWGYRREVLQYQRDYAHAAIDAGADIVFGHGPHMILPIETYNGKPVFYGLGNFSFKQEHKGRAHVGWTGMHAALDVHGQGADARIAKVLLGFVQRNDSNQTLPVSTSDISEECDLLIAASSNLGTQLQPDGDTFSFNL